MKKKILVASGVAACVFVVAWIICVFLFPVTIIDGKEYNTKKLKKLSEKREFGYNELYSSLLDEINRIIGDLYINQIDNKNEIEKRIILNGDLSLLDEINKNNLSLLTKEELRILRNTFFAKYGYIFQFDDLSRHFNQFAWYKPQYNNVDGRLSGNDRKTIEMIREVENEQINMDMQGVLKTFYAHSIDIDETYYQLMTKCNSRISFPFQIRKQSLLTEIFPAKIKVIEYNNILYDEFTLMVFIEQYKSIIGKIIEAKTTDILEYISFYSHNSDIELMSVIDSMGYTNFYEISDKSFFDYYFNQCIIADKIIDKINILITSLSDENIELIKIDDDNCSKIAVDELEKSMSIVSSRLIKEAKDIFIKGIEYQTEIYTDNIDKYVDWYYSYFAALDKSLTNIGGFLLGEKSVVEKYYLDNFNRIMNKNANFYVIIEDDLYRQINITRNIYYTYIELRNSFSVNTFQITPDDTMSSDDYIEPYIGVIVTYFDHVFESLNTANNFYLQEYTINDNEAVKSVKTSVKLLSGVNFWGGMVLDYLFLKSQQLLNSNQLRQQIFDSMIESQENRIAIINDPFNYLFDKLRIGSAIFVDNYFVGLNTYQHYGVYIGNGKVIHFAPFEGQEVSSENGIIHETTLEKFLDGRALQIDMTVEREFSEDEIIKRACSRLGEKGYDLLTNNCEHFARWCVTGHSVSYQVENLPQKVDNTFLLIQDKYNMVSKFFELFN